MTPLDLRAARQLLSLSQADLVGRSRVSIATVRRFEAGKSIGYLHADALRRAVEDAGVMIVPMGTEIGGRTAVGGVVLIRRPGEAHPPPPAG